MGLLHGIDLFSDKLHLRNLRRDFEDVSWSHVLYRRMSVSQGQPTLMLETFALSRLSLEFGPDLVEKLIQSSRISWGDSPHGAMRVHRHCAGQDSARDDSSLDIVMVLTASVYREVCFVDDGFDDG